MLNKIFVAADTPQGSFDSGMAALLDKSSEGEVGMYLIHLYSGETLQWPFKVIGQRAIPLPLAYHYDTPSYEDGWQEYHSKCFHVLLQMPEGDNVILPSQLMGISSLAMAVFKTKWEYGQCCLLFRMGEPSHFVPLGMMNIRVFGSSASQSQTSIVSASGGTSGSKHSVESSTSKPQTSGHSGLIQMLSTSSSSFSQAAGLPAVQGSPGIPEDFEVQQPKSKSTKKRRISGGQSGGLSSGQTIDEQTDPGAASACIKRWVMENILDRVAFNWITEGFCQMERLHMLEVAAVADKDYTQVLKDFPNFLTRGSVTIALVDTLAKACEKHTLAVLEGIEQSHENWVQLKVQRSNVKAQLLSHNGQLFEHLLTEVANLSPAAFSNVLNLSVGLLPPIQHTMPPVQPTIVLTTQVPTLGVIPSVGINFSVANGAGGGGDDGSDGGQQADDTPAEDHDASNAEPEEDPEGGDPGDHDNDVTMVSIPSHRTVRHSVTPLSTCGQDMDAGSSSGSMATDSSRIGGEVKPVPHICPIEIC